MPNSKAALQAPGSGDLTNSLASCSRRLTPFLEHHVRTVAVNLYISINTQEPSLMFGTVSFKEGFAFTLMQPEDASRVDPISDKDHQVFQAK